jgi:oxalate decarboxylase/phosphoglucose isomerase-like protein (cupin superfamily)
MALVARLFGAGVALAVMSVATVTAQQLDPKVVGFKLPDQIEWKTNPAGTNRSAVLQGDPSKPGPYAMLLQWLPGNMSRPHWHPNDRLITVVKGTWWVGSGGVFDTDATVPMPAGTFVTHYGRQVHYDGAKDEEAILVISGEGPATTNPFMMGVPIPPKPPS